MQSIHFERSVYDEQKRGDWNHFVIEGLKSFLIEIWTGKGLQSGLAAQHHLNPDLTF